MFPLITHFVELLKNIRPPQHRIEAAQKLPPQVREYIKQSKEFPTVAPHTRLAGAYAQDMGADDVNFIYPQTRREPTWKFEQDGKALDLAVESYLQFDNSEVILEAVIGGAGVVQLPKFVAAKAIALGELQPILQSYIAQAGLPIAVLYPQKRYLSAKVRVFVEFMTELTAALKQIDIVD